LANDGRFSSGFGQNVSVGGPNDIRLSFNEAVEVYDQVRPSYPTALFDVLFETLPSRPEIVEVGPGTGQATNDLLASSRCRSACRRTSCASDMCAGHRARYTAVR
jgi:hypothetical protein